MTRVTPTLGILEGLKVAASAEEFFDLLDVRYDPRVLNVARLHILKRMGEWLEAEEIAGLSDLAVAERCKAALQRVYQSFERASPRNGASFKVFRDAIALRRRAFVPFTALLEPRRAETPRPAPAGQCREG